MKNNMLYAIQDKITDVEIKEIRKKLGLTQYEFSRLVNSGKKTIEDWEVEGREIKGPIVTLVKMLTMYPQFVEVIKVNKKPYHLRLWYMYRNDVCSILDIDEVNKNLIVKNFTEDNVRKAFGKIEVPTYNDYESFVESRCFPKSRDNLKLYLKELDLPFYDPIMIIEKTQGRMADDDFWIKIERS